VDLVRRHSGRKANTLNPEPEIDRLRAELQAAQARLQAAAAVAGPQLGTLEFALDERGELVFAGYDEMASRVITVAQPQYVGRPVGEVFVGIPGTGLAAALVATLRHGEPLLPRSFVPAGTRLAQAFTLFGFQTGPGRMVVKFWESTGLDEQREMARRNQQLLGSIFAGSPVAIALVRDRDSTLVDVNDEWTRLCGWTREQALGRTALQLGLWPDLDARERLVGQLREQGRLQDVPLSFTRPDGRRVHFALHGARVPMGDEPHLLMYMVDETARELARVQLQLANARLEARVAERTAELARARDEAERASRSKSDFLSAMSHELRTPMNAILGFAQLLANEPAAALAPAQRGHVRQILRAGAHLLELINEVLDLARIEAGKLQVSLEPVDLAALLADCLALMQPVALEHGVQLVATPPPGCHCHVQADRTRLRQVLLNLLANAVKYNREQGRVWVDCSADEQGVRIGVCDTGPGLSAAQQQRLFQAFERLGAEQAPIEGTGIGLALSRQLVGLMHGEIGVDSAVGRGSTFWVRLQRAAPAAAEPLPAAVAPAGSDAGAEAGAAGRRKVLYIEDNPVNVVLMEAVLAQRPGLQMISAPLPGLGLDLARSEQPDLILMDIQLPGMDGYELLRRLRRAAATQQVPVIAISANAMPGDQRRGLAAGFVHYLTKPIDIAQVLAAIDAVLGP